MSGANKRAWRIAVVTETYPPEINGVGRTIGAMVEGLRARGHSIHLVRPRQSTESTNNAKLDTTLCRGLPLPRYNGLQIGLPAKRLLVRLWRERRPDVVQVVTEGPLGASAISAAHALQIPVISEFHTRFNDYSHYYGFGIFSGLVTRYLRRLHNRTACALVPTEELGISLQAAGYQCTAVVGRGIDSALFNAGRRNEALRRSWGAEPQHMVALYVGRLAAEKNLPLFVAACEAIRGSVPHLRVVLVGDGPVSGQLRTSNAEFIFAGTRSGVALAQHYASADIFLFPSLTETFGNVTTEALASGLAVVAFDYAGARQYIRHGENGLLAPYGDTEAFVAAAKAVASDGALRERLRRGARAMAHELSWDRALDQLEAVFARAFERSPPDTGLNGARRVESVSAPGGDHAAL